MICLIFSIIIVLLVLVLVLCPQTRESTIIYPLGIMLAAAVGYTFAKNNEKDTYFPSISGGNYEQNVFILSQSGNFVKTDKIDSVPLQMIEFEKKDRANVKQYWESNLFVDTNPSLTMEVALNNSIDMLQLDDEEDDDVKAMAEMFFIEKFKNLLILELKNDGDTDYLYINFIRGIGKTIYDLQGMMTQVDEFAKSKQITVIKLQDNSMTRLCPRDESSSIALLVYRVLFTDLKLESTSIYMKYGYNYEYKSCEEIEQKLNSIRNYKISELNKFENSKKLYFLLLNFVNKNGLFLEEGSTMCILAKIKKENNCREIPEIVNLFINNRKCSANECQIFNDMNYVYKCLGEKMLTKHINV
jgi:hypothetical protein